MPEGWPAPYLSSRSWRERLTAARTLELTWESEAAPAAIAAGGLSSGDLFGWREPTLPLGRASQIGDAVGGWAYEGSRIVLASDQAAFITGNVVHINGGSWFG